MQFCCKAENFTLYAQFWSQSVQLVLTIYKVDYPYATESNFMGNSNSPKRVNAVSSNFLKRFNLTAAGISSNLSHLEKKGVSCNTVKHDKGFRGHFVS